MRQPQPETGRTTTSCSRAERECTAVHQAVPESCFTQFARAMDDSTATQSERRRTCRAASWVETWFVRKMAGFEVLIPIDAGF